MNYNYMQTIADKHNLGKVFFETRMAINTGNPIEVGYVYVNGMRELFCKKQSHQKDFYLCNDFNKLSNGMTVKQLQATDIWNTLRSNYLKDSRGWSLGTYLLHYARKMVNDKEIDLEQFFIITDDSPIPF